MSEANSSGCFPSRRAISFCWSTRRPNAPPRSPRRSSRRPAISAPMRRSTVERLAEFHAVENTYLSTFQTLGGLGLLVGTSGWPRCCCATCSSGAASWRCLARSAIAAATSLRSSLPRTLLLLGWGLAAGAFCAAVAIAPVRARARRPAAGGGRRRAAADCGLRGGIAIVSYCDESGAARAAARSAASGIDGVDQVALRGTWQVRGRSYGRCGLICID